jgi:hypothetical protein
MLRNHKFHLDKKLLALERERNALFRRPEMVPIDPPIQRGWIRRWVLTQWAMHHPQRSIFEDILREVNIEQRIPHRAFRHRKSGRRKVMHVTSQGFRRIRVGRWRQLQWSQEHKAFFRPVYHVRQNNRFLVHFVLRSHHMFELKIERRLIHQLPLLDPGAESRLAEIRGFLNPEAERRLAWLQGRRHWHCRSYHCSRRYESEKAARRRMVRLRMGDWDAEKRRQNLPALLSIHIHHTSSSRLDAGANFPNEGNGGARLAASQTALV